MEVTFKKTKKGYLKVFDTVGEKVGYIEEDGDFWTGKPYNSKLIAYHELEEIIHKMKEVRENGID